MLPSPYSRSPLTQAPSDVRDNLFRECPLHTGREAPAAEWSLFRKPSVHHGLKIRDLDPIGDAYGGFANGALQGAGAAL